MVIGKSSGFVNDPFAGTGIDKIYTKEFKAQIAKRRKKSKLSAVTNNGETISGSFYIADDIRPSDFLRSIDTKRVLLIDASINGVERKTPILIIVENCQYIELLDEFESSTE